MKKLTAALMTLAFITFTAGTAPAETYVEGYLGYTFGVTSPNPLKLDVNPYYRGSTKTSLEFPRTLSTGMLYGTKLGTWFSRDGFPKIKYPDWMKYFGFYLDFNYHQFDISDLVRDTLGTRRMYVSPSFYPHYQQFKFDVDGNASIFTLAFMFAFRYGFFPTERVPFGKFQPYVAVGPAIFITSMEPNYVIQPSFFKLFPIIDRTVVPGTFKSVANIGLEAELGLRFYFTRKDGPEGRAISLDTSVKYRLVRPTLSYDIVAFGYTHRLRFEPQFNLFSIQTGLAYHF